MKKLRLKKLLATLDKYKGLETVDIKYRGFGSHVWGLALVSQLPFQTGRSINGKTEILEIEPIHFSSGKQYKVSLHHYQYNGKRLVYVSGRELAKTVDDMLTEFIRNCPSWDHLELDGKPFFSGVPGKPAHARYHGEILGRLVSKTIPFWTIRPEPRINVWPTIEQYGPLEIY